MTVRCTVVGGAALALTLVLALMPAAPRAQVPPQGPIADLRARVAALEQAAADLSAALSALGTDVAAGDAALQAQIDAANAEVLGLQQLFSDLNTAVNSASGDILSLRERVAELEDALDDLSGGLTSYDRLAGLPCTSASGQASRVLLIGRFKNPVCADGRFVDVGLTVFDTQTNLLWEKKTTAVGSGANPNDLHDVDNIYNWCQATGDRTGVCGRNATSWIGQVNAEVFAGFSNWRVPTRDELLEIVDLSAGPPRIDPIFGPTQAAFYWLGTESGFGGFSAGLVSFFDGRAGGGQKTSGDFVRAVRSDL